ncbi:DUF5069 domain-containing protein [Actomonas aquatica]|uniref:DUF5069 domain-containing protein n=1 Tax=Actomonas aquatica TaxID=2866162 RepID=A0ABZ1CA04_9BACT|nr:DUF5069 domain-containing protein [Opitutus sp. WL0086]WRQ88429.1 DUF5069 domain-containing protein [Opitutus sp. WL0086]
MSITHFAFPTTFRELYDHAVQAYRAGASSSAELYDEAQTAWLAANGINAQAMFDYAEDDVSGGAPGFEHALAIETIRRDYFLNVQKGVPSTVVADPDTWAGKAEAIDGIVWLPRILPKVRAKLRGELPASMMYCCGGDRNFFRTHDILPAEFLNLAWRHFDDDDAIIAWVKARSVAV